MEWKQFASFQKSLLCRDTTGTAVTEQEVEAVLHNRPLVRSSFVLISQIYWIYRKTEYLKERSSPTLYGNERPRVSEINGCGDARAMSNETGT